MPIVGSLLWHLLNNYQIVTFDILQGKQDSNPHRRFWYSPKNGGRVDIPLNYILKLIIQESWLPVLHLLYVHLRGLRNGDLR